MCQLDPQAVWNMNPKELWYYKKGARQRQKAKDVRNLRLINCWTEDEITLDDLENKQQTPKSSSDKEVLNRVKKYQKLEKKYQNMREGED